MLRAAANSAAGSAVGAPLWACINTPRSLKKLVRKA